MVYFLIQGMNVYAQDSIKSARTLEGMAIDERGKYFVEAKAIIKISKQLLLSAREIIAYQNMDAYHLRNMYKEDEEEIVLRLNLYFLDILFLSTKSSEEEKRYKGELLTTPIDLLKVQRIELHETGIYLYGTDLNTSSIHFEQISMDDLFNFYTYFKKMQTRYNYDLKVDKHIADYKKK